MNLEIADRYENQDLEHMYTHYAHFSSFYLFSRVMMGAFPLIIPEDTVMKMKIAQKANRLLQTTDTD